MNRAHAQRRVYLFGNHSKPHAPQAIEKLENIASTRFQVVGAALDRQIPDAARDCDRVVVVGGDGTLIAVARALAARPVPLIGVNVGKLGFLAEFLLEDLIEEFDRAVCDDSLISRRAALEVQIQNSVSGRTSPAINDCVIQAGPPFRMITLGVKLDNVPLSVVSGDGLIVSSPSGSTAHNLSAGGPIVQPNVDAMILTPMNPHSLTHKPIVVHRDARLEIEVITVNDGTTAIIDGQESHPLRKGDRVVVRRYANDFLLVSNPKYGRWYSLTTKLHWGRPLKFEP